MLMRALLRGGRAPPPRSFRELGVSERVEQALAELGITQPTRIQQQSVHAVLAGKDVLCTAQTGTGKTLAYLVPLAEQILRAEAAAAAAAGSEGDAQRALMPISRPQALVLTPSRELAAQVSSVAKRLAHTAKFASCTITSGERKSIQQRNLARRLDLVIGTPGRVAKCIKAGDFFLSRLSTVVVDEADTIFDAKMGFRKELDEILGPIQASAAKRKQPLQVVLVAATVKPPLDQVLMKRFGNLRLVSDANVHQTPALLHEDFVRVTPETKHSALRDALAVRAGAKGDKAIVFCQNSASCRSTDHMLRESGVQSLCLHGAMPPARRLESMHKFTHDDALKVLVCTDLAARGLDFSHVRHVVMFDFPRSAVDYVHRAGRTGRAGVKGFVTSLVTKYDVPLANSIREANQHRRASREFNAPAAAARGLIPVDKEARALVAEGGGDDVARAPRPAKKQVRGHQGVGTKKLKHHKIRSFRR
ncbi:hypothetical protein PybrP1_008082 [[Pythium] brassicae (nom. inval.)]|nr:hypothetical protein PybrP1_008082 [[Pythium] brassicae (nom. inval.)]